MVTIRLATQNDVKKIVDIHCDAFKNFFLTSLGKKFLYIYYTCFIKSDETVVMCAEENGVLLGFSAATKICKGFNGRLIKKNAPKFMMVAFNLIFTNPTALLRLINNLTKKSDEQDDNEDYGELYSIGVHPYAQGKGIGKALLINTETAMNGIRYLSLTTDYNNNESTIAFYNRCGYKKLYEFTAYPNRKMLRLIKKLN